MYFLSVKTKGNSNPQGKPRVFFTCHPGDFEKSFEKICSDIFASQDCAVYYTENMSYEITADEYETEINQMNLFVIPVSFKLLSENSRAMQKDFAFAKEKHIPVLPIMLETGLDVLYSKPDKFGELQYLNPFSHDLTEISYEEKLKKYLSGVLFDNETAEKVRKAFDAYIFLSYRKKDRKYANELMRLIHSDPLCRDIAIWYDEFLTPGESFNDMIGEMLEKCDLFTLLVTPNLINEKNYVQSTEYPMAKKANKAILPVEIEKTEPDELHRQYEDIPDCVSTDGEEELRRRLVDAFKKYALRTNDTDPAHNFLIGLAYFEGIDVEINIERGIELIRSAAEANLPDAVYKICEIYHKGIGVKINKYEEKRILEQFVDYLISAKGEDDEETLKAMNTLASVCSEIGNNQMALELYEKIYSVSCRIHKKPQYDTIVFMANLASTYGTTGNFEKASELAEKACTLAENLMGKESDETLSIRSIYSHICFLMHDYQKAIEVEEKNYQIKLKIFGDTHKQVLLSLDILAMCYYEIKRKEKAIEYARRAYYKACEMLGENHPDTVFAMSSWSKILFNIGEYDEGITLNEKIYKILSEYYTEEHPDCITAIGNLSYGFGRIGDIASAVKYAEKAYTLSNKIYGKCNKHTILTLKNYSECCFKAGNIEKALKLRELEYATLCETVGADDEDAVQSLSVLTMLYDTINDYENGLIYSRKLYRHICRIYGEDSPQAHTVLKNIEICQQSLTGFLTPEDVEKLSNRINLLSEQALETGNCGEYEKSLEMYEELYYLYEMYFGKRSDYIINPLLNICVLLHNLKKYSESAERYKELLSVYNELYGETDENSLEIIEKIAINLIMAGKVKEAEEIRYKKYLLLCSVKGKDSKDAIMYLGGLARNCYDNNDFEDAVRFYSMLYDIYLKKEDYAMCKGIIESIATLYDEANDYDKAAEAYIRLYEFNRVYQSDNKEEVISALYRSATCLYWANKHEKAATIFEKVFSDGYRYLGEENTYTKKALSSLEIIYGKENIKKLFVLVENLYADIVLKYSINSPEAKKAEQMLDFLYLTNCNRTERCERMYFVKRMFVDEEDEEIVSLMLKIAYACENEPTGLQKAYRYYEKVFLIRKKHLGEKDYSTIFVLYLMARNRKNNKEYENAMKLFYKAYLFLLILYKENRSGEDKDLNLLTKCREELCEIILLLDNLAYNYSEASDFKKSLELNKIIYEHRCGLFGKTDIDTLKSLKKICIFSKKCGKMEMYSKYKAIYLSTCEKADIEPEEI